MKIYLSVCKSRINSIQIHPFMGISMFQELSKELFNPWCAIIYSAAASRVFRIFTQPMPQGHNVKSHSKSLQNDQRKKQQMQFELLKDVTIYLGCKAVPKCTQTSILQHNCMKHCKPLHHYYGHTTATADLLVLLLLTHHCYYQKMQHTEERRPHCIVYLKSARCPFQLRQELFTLLYPILVVNTLCFFTQPNAMSLDVIVNIHSMFYIKS